MHVWKGGGKERKKEVWMKEGKDEDRAKNREVENRKQKREDGDGLRKGKVRGFM